MAGNNGQKPPMPAGNVPLIRPMVEVACWICEQKFKAPAEAKGMPRVVCGRCAAGFEEFIWSLYKQAVNARQSLDDANKECDNNNKGEAK
jgi:hypothetical protein